MKIEKWKMLKDYAAGEEEGVGTIEIVLILVVLIALVIIFRDQIQDILDGVFESINESINSFY